MKTLFLLSFCGAAFVAGAQERQTGKPLPPSRPLEVQAEADSQRNSTPLPKIDLPEFVITGDAMIGPPDIEKGELPEGGVYRRGLEENGPGIRERETLDLGNRFRQTMFAGEPRLNGSISGSLGSFLTSRIDASFGQFTGSYDYLLKARYFRTKGYVTNSDASGGGLGASGTLVARNETTVFDGMRIKGGLDAAMNKYRLYGSFRPETVRDISAASALVEVASGIESPLSYEAGLRYRTMTIQDSSTETIENVVRFGAAIQVPFTEFPVRARFEATLGTVAAGSTENISLVEIALESSPVTKENFIVSGSIHGYAAKGMNNQSIGRIYPRFSMGYHVTERHTAHLRFEPRVDFSSLRQQVDMNPYLSANAIIRHPDTRIDLSGTLESQWGEPLMTRLTARYQSISEYPLYADTSGGRIWALAYAGRTNVLSFELEAVANVSPNDYFAGAFVFLDARNPGISGLVPNMPAIQGSALYRLTTPVNLVVSPRIGYVHSRRLDVAGNQTMAGYFSTGIRFEYVGLPRWTIYGEVQNLFDSRHEIWRGYRAEPFNVSLGLSVRW